MNEELRGRRIRLVGDGRGAIAKAARLLDTPYRTYQDWELGNASCPGAVLVALDALLLLADLYMARPTTTEGSFVSPDDLAPIDLKKALDRVRARFPDILTP